MNAEYLLTKFHLLGDGRETVEQLRKLIVALAISGRLAPIGGAASDARTLFAMLSDGGRRAENQNAQLRNEKPIEVLRATDLPKAFSSSIKFVRLGSIARIEKGLTGIVKAKRGPFPLVTTSAHHSTCDHYDFDGEAVIVPLVSSAGHGKASLHRLHYQHGKFALGTILAAVFPDRSDAITARFLFEYLTAFREELLVSQMIGTANVSLSVAKVSNVPVPVVSPSVQEKVDELMELCDRLEEAREAREAARDRLTASSLARLNAPNADRFHEHARFAVDALSELTARPDQIKQLRQTILDFAVCGKLVPQDAREEPAPALLKRIAAENLRLATAGRIKQAEVTADRGTTNHRTSAPHGWAIATLRSVCSSITDGDHLPPPKAELGIPFLVIGNVRSQRINFAGCRFVPPEYYEALDPIRRPQRGDLLYTLVGSYGIPVVIRDDQPFCVQRHIGILRPSQLMDVNYLAYALSCRLVFDQAESIATGVAQKTVPLGGLRNILIPVPPIAEQYRIVAKVDQLITFCDQLEASLSNGEKTRRRLLNSLVLEALGPDEASGRMSAGDCLSLIQKRPTEGAPVRGRGRTIPDLPMKLES